MRTRIQKWENSLALCIPKVFVVSVGFHGMVPTERFFIINLLKFA
jgi:hypothetical protein